MIMSMKYGHFQISLDFGTDERGILSRQTIDKSSCGSPLYRVSHVATEINGLSEKNGEREIHYI